MAVSKCTKSYVEEMLECPVCLESVTDPHTLKTCFHTYCKKCVDELLTEQNNRPLGIVCPVCNGFTPKNEIRGNFFINDLAVKIRMSKPHHGHQLCDQCPDDKAPTVAGWRCVDCKMNLCIQCQSSHLKIKLLLGHRVLPLIEENVESILPKIKENSKHIDEIIENVTKAIAEIEDKIKEIKKSNSACRKEVDERAELKINEIKVYQKILNDSINFYEHHELKKLEAMKEDLQKKQKQDEALNQVVRTSLDLLEREGHATLLTELLGLCQKVYKIQEKKGDTQSLLQVATPKFCHEEAQWNKLKGDGLLGKLVYNTIDMIFVTGTLVTNEIKLGPRYWNYNIKEYFARQFANTVSIALHDWCSRIAVINDEIWASMYYSDIEIYDKTGKHVTTVNVRNSTSVEQAINNDIFITCHSKGGVYVMKDKHCNPVKICDGTFSDVCSYKDRMFALALEKKLIVEFNYEDRCNGWKEIRRINLELYINPEHLDTLIVMDNPKRSDELLFYVSTWNNQSIHQYNEQGQLLWSYGSSYAHESGQPIPPLLCGVDNQSVILCADYENKKFKILDPTTGQFSCTEFKCPNRMFDAKIDNTGSIWTVDGSYTLRKYELAK